jgi:predicted DNA-binding ribbon-helix-helix protein
VGRRPRPLEELLVELDPELRDCHERVLALRDTRVAHHVASDSAQTGSVSFSVTLAGSTIELGAASVEVESEFYDLALMKQLAELTRLLRGRLGARIDEVRQQLAVSVLSHQVDVATAIREDRPWRPPG